MYNVSAFGTVSFRLKGAENTLRPRCQQGRSRTAHMCCQATEKNGKTASFQLIQGPAIAEQGDAADDQKEDQKRPDIGPDFGRSIAFQQDAPHDSQEMG